MSLVFLQLLNDGVDGLVVTGDGVTYAAGVARDRQTVDCLVHVTGFVTGSDHTSTPSLAMPDRPPCGLYSSLNHSIPSYSPPLDLTSYAEGLSVSVLSFSTDPRTDI